MKSRGVGGADLKWSGSQVPEGAVKGLTVTLSRDIPGLIFRRSAVRIALSSVLVARTVNQTLKQQLCQTSALWKWCPVSAVGDLSQLTPFHVSVI